MDRRQFIQRQSERSSLILNLCYASLQAHTDATMIALLIRNTRELLVHLLHQLLILLGNLLFALGR